MVCDQIEAVANAKPARRHVSDEEVRRAYYGDPRDEASMKAAADNRGIIKAVLRRYEGQIQADDLELCGLHAVWKTLQYHRDEFGQKFTTSLHRVTRWVCGQQLRRDRTGKPDGTESLFTVVDGEAQLRDVEEAVEVTDDESFDRREFVTECVELLPCSWMKDVVRAYYYERLSLEQIGKLYGFSKESCRKKLARATYAFSEICKDALRKRSAENLPV